MEPQGLKITVFRIKSDPFQQSTSQQLLADRGPAAGGEALEYIYIYIYIYIYMAIYCISNVWIGILGVWTCILDVWTGILASVLEFLMSGLVLGLSGLVF